MTLLLTVFAAIIATIKWYKNAPKDEWKIGTLSLMYWGASLMWMCDAIFEYAEAKEEFFQPAVADMLNDTFLGFTVIALGLLIWLAVLLIKDPKGVIKNALKKNENEN
ncbi:MAG: hypothetical protein J6T40_08765 [Clostridiales bacterium]|nr:hypothetical protein [Clostridiales bacterium]